MELSCTFAIREKHQITVLTAPLHKHTFQLISLPGHTAGQTAVLIPEEKVIFTGDNIVNKKQGYLHNALASAWLESLKKLEKFYSI